MGKVNNLFQVFASPPTLVQTILRDKLMTLVWFNPAVPPSTTRVILCCYIPRAPATLSSFSTLHWDVLKLCRARGSSTSEAKHIKDKQIQSGETACRTQIGFLSSPACPLWLRVCLCFVCQQCQMGFSSLDNNNNNNSYMKSIMGGAKFLMQLWWKCVLLIV